MRGIKVVAVVSIFLLSVAVLLNAGQNKFGVADEQKTVFSHSVQVGETLLPKGEYKIRHTTEGAVHGMVFTQLKASNPATARAKCQIVSVEKKIEQTYFGYQKSSTNDYLLQEMAFKGDTAKHVF